MSMGKRVPSRRRPSTSRLTPMTSRMPVSPVLGSGELFTNAWEFGIRVSMLLPTRSDGRNPKTFCVALFALSMIPCSSTVIMASTTLSKRVLRRSSLSRRLRWAPSKSSLILRRASTVRLLSKFNPTVRRKKSIPTKRMLISTMVRRKVPVRLAERTPAEVSSSALSWMRELRTSSNAGCA